MVVGSGVLVVVVVVGRLCRLSWSSLVDGPVGGAASLAAAARALLLFALEEATTFSFIDDVDLVLRLGDGCVGVAGRGVVRTQLTVRRAHNLNGAVSIGGREVSSEGCCLAALRPTLRTRHAPT